MIDSISQNIELVLVALSLIMVLEATGLAVAVYFTVTKIDQAARDAEEENARLRSQMAELRAELEEGEEEESAAVRRGETRRGSGRVVEDDLRAARETLQQAQQQLQQVEQRLARTPQQQQQAQQGDGSHEAPAERISVRFTDSAQEDPEATGPITVRRPPTIDPPSSFSSDSPSADVDISVSALEEEEEAAAAVAPAATEPMAEAVAASDDDDWTSSKAYGVESTDRAVVGAPHKKSHDLILIHYATDRAVDGDVYLPLRGEGGLAYGGVLVSIPHDHRPSVIERPFKILGVQIVPENPDKHIVLTQTIRMSESGFLSSLRDQLEHSKEKSALVFIHGFNVDFANSVRRTAQLKKDLNYEGAAVTYSWPSAEEPVAGYAKDESTIGWTAPHLQYVLERLLTDIDAETVHVIAHSMGNRALVEAISRMDFEALTKQGAARLDQVVFTAPDIDADTFKQFAERWHSNRPANRFTLYASSKDKALAASHALHGYGRAGDSGRSLVVVEGVDTVDASEVHTDFIQHSYFGGAKSVISDLFYLIGEGLPPDRRAFLDRKEHDNGTYWRFRL